jgi:hypothetical protein
MDWRNSRLKIKKRPPPAHRRCDYLELAFRSVGPSARVDELTDSLQRRLGTVDIAFHRADIVKADEWFMVVQSARAAVLTLHEVTKYVEYARGCRAIRRSEVRHVEAPPVEDHL